MRSRSCDGMNEARRPSSGNWATRLSAPRPEAGGPRRLTARQGCGHRGAGALVGRVGEDEDLPGEAGLHDAVGPGRDQIVGVSRRAGRAPGGVPSGRAMTCTFMPCFLRFCE